MAYTLLNITKTGGAGGNVFPYFHQEDIDEIYKRASDVGKTIVALQTINIVLPKNGQQKQIIALAGATAVDNNANPPKSTLFTGAKAIVALPCPPFNLPPKTYIDANGNTTTEP